MILGITGISGSGKHSAARYLEQHGWKILDTDKIAHRLYRPYTYVWKDIVDLFGEEILSKNDLIDRQKLGAIVFDSANIEKADNALFELGKIVHPAIKRNLKEAFYRQRKRKQSVAVISALWKEVEFETICEKVLLVTADSDIAMDRVKKRDGITDDQYRQRVKNQSAMESADFVIKNNGTLQAFYRTVNKKFLQ